MNIMKTVALTLNKNAPMSTLLHTSVTHMTMLLTIKENADHVREDVVLGVCQIISVFAGLSVEAIASAVKTSRRHVHMSTNSLFPNSVIHGMIFVIMKLCVRRVRADVVIEVPIITSVIATLSVEGGMDPVAKISKLHVQMSTENLTLVATDVVIGAGFTNVVVTVTVEERMNVAKTSKRNVQMSINSSSQLHVIHMMVFQTMRKNVSHARTDVVIGAGFTSVVVTVTVEDGTDAVETSRRHVQMSINSSSQLHVIHMMVFQTMRKNVSHARTDVVIAAPTVTSVIVTLTAEALDPVAKISR